MGTRGRKSSAALSIAAPSRLETIERPAPPDELTDEQASEWRAVVERMPADWFPRETWPLLIQYCRHVVTAKRVQQLVENLQAEDDFDLAAWEKALKIQRQESGIIAALSTKMRLSQQTSYDKSKKKGSAGRSKPWE
jgi:hypothetical protein